MGHPITGLSGHSPLRPPAAPRLGVSSPWHPTPRGLHAHPLRGRQQGARRQPLRQRPGVSDSSLTPPIKPF